jgi:hypothetical protein
MSQINNRTKFKQEIFEKVVDPARRVTLYPDTGEAYLTPPGGSYSRFTTGASYTPQEFWYTLASAIQSFETYIAGFFGRVDGFQNDDVLLDVRVRTPQGNKWIYNLPMHINNIEASRRSDLIHYLKDGGQPLAVKILYDGGKPSECAPVSYQFLHPPVQHVIAELQNTGTTPQTLTGSTTLVGGFDNTGVSAPGTSGGGFGGPFDGNSLTPAGMNYGASGFNCDPSCCCYAYRFDINQAGIAYNIDPNFIAAILTNESHGDTQALSRTGAMGLCQLEPNTFNGDAYPAAFAKNPTLKKDPRNATTSIWCCAAYVNLLITQYVNSPGNMNPLWIIRAYNGGAGIVNPSIGRGVTDPYKPIDHGENDHYLVVVARSWKQYQARSTELGKLKINQRREVKYNDPTNAGSKSGIPVGTTD